MLSFFEIFTIATLQFVVPPSAGNLSLVRNDTIFIRSAAQVSGWVVSQKQSLRNRRVRVKILKSSWDGSLSISPRVDLNSTSGMYAQPTRLRFCPYGLPRTLHVEWRRNGVQSDLSVGPTGADPFWVSMTFINDSVRFEHSTDGVKWRKLYQEKFDLPGYTLADSFYIELQAHKTPSGGEMIATQVRLEDLSAPPPPPITPPVLLPSTTAQVVWRRNREPDVAGYRLHYGRATRSYDTHLDVGHDTSYTLTALAPKTLYYFAVTAYDSAGNESVFSNEVSALTGDAPVIWSEYDLNQTGEVDLFDWLLLLRLLGYETGHALFNPRADIAKDGTIDGFDKAKFARWSGVF